MRPCGVRPERSLSRSCVLGEPVIGAWYADRVMSTLVGAIESTLLRWEPVRAAWLFGSAADGTSGPTSDVDVAVLGCAALPLDRLAQLAADLERACGKPVDVVVVERASPVLAFEVVSRGIRLSSREPDAADDWEDRALRRYLGTRALRRMVHEHVRADLSEKR